jgi:hypothetical protein
MSKKNFNAIVMGPRAMEMVMRDVLGGMEELAVMKSFESIHNVFEIISITPEQTVNPAELNKQAATPIATVLPFKTD